MKTATIALALLLSACNTADRPSKPPIPEPRPPTLDELAGSRLLGSATYPVGTDDPWSIWSGQLDLELAVPAASEPAPVASASLGGGLDGTCLGSPEGHWDYDQATGALTVSLDGDFGHLEVALVVEQYWTRVGGDDYTTSPVLQPHLRALGTWSATLASALDCDGDFAGGTAGVLEAQGVEVEAVVASPAPPVQVYELRALALDGDGAVTPVYSRVR